MNNREAKFVLSAYRANGSDAGDPAMADALAQARNDPALNAWFAREQAHDAAMTAKLREIAPPAGLREAIMAGMRAGQSSRPIKRRQWQRPIWLAMAATIALLLSVAAWWRLAPVRGGTLDEFATNFVARGFMLAKRSADVAELKTWLAERRGPLPAELPGHFDRLRALGCRALNFQNRDVSLVCFERDGKEFHVFVARREDFPERPLRSAPEFSTRRNLVAAAWSDARNHYVVVSDAAMAELKQLL